MMFWMTERRSLRARAQPSLCRMVARAERALSSRSDMGRGGCVEGVVVVAVVVVVVLMVSKLLWVRSEVWV